MPSLPSISTLPHSPDSTLTSALDLLFEPSPPLHTLTLPVLRSTAFPDYNTLIAAIRAQLDALAASGDVATLSEILCSHPRLGEKKVDSEQSRAEQAQLQGGKEEEGELLRKLNEEYEGVFVGLRYVVFVNGRPRPVIMEDMRRRIDRRDIEAERREAIQVR
ncbi:Oxo-4-hydroxy-4-carboxy-5-ureidoimidazoline decarboxylase [Phaeosphaeria sp. MPI-PUGE-AT-0046c]|nr:Oxo-4-hydroxy-4-carboxy-5-ureidoimidazoline decarboxylase [Phaeosphaeria sp. MPI-PUGE-AT-0046c]